MAYSIILDDNGNPIGNSSGAFKLDNLVAENVKSGVNIGGVVGTYAMSESDIAPYINGTMTVLNNSLVTSIKASYCSGNTNLTELSLPNCTSIGTYGFSGCSNLTSIYLPKLVSTGTNAFENCDKLTSVTLDSLTAINSYAFYSCDKLEVLVLPKCTSISSGLNGCYKLRSLTLGANQVCSLSVRLPHSGSQHIIVYVPSDLIESYKVASNWSTDYNAGRIEFQAIT